MLLNNESKIPIYYTMYIMCFLSLIYSFYARKEKSSYSLLPILLRFNLGIYLTIFLQNSVILTTSCNLSLILYFSFCRESIDATNMTNLTVNQMNTIRFR